MFLKPTGNPGIRRFCRRPPSQTTTSSLKAPSNANMLPVPLSKDAINKLQRRQSYLANAPFQRKSKRRALSDAAMKLFPSSWIGPPILKAHDMHEYKKDKKRTEKVYEHYQEKRQTSLSTTKTTEGTIGTTRESSVGGSPSASCGREATGRDPTRVDPLEKTNDPWALPPMQELASLGNSSS